MSMAICVPCEFLISVASARIIQQISGIEHHGPCAGQFKEKGYWDGCREVKVYHFRFGGSLGSIVDRLECNQGSANIMLQASGPPRIIFLVMQGGVCRVRF